MCACVQSRQKAASTAVYVARSIFDRATTYNLESMNECKWLRRILFLETVAGMITAKLFKIGVLPQALCSAQCVTTCAPVRSAGYHEVYSAYLSC